MARPLYDYPCPLGCRRYTAVGGLNSGLVAFNMWRHIRKAHPTVDAVPMLARVRAYRRKEAS